jgi:hypothetical protein
VVRQFSITPPGHFSFLILELAFVIIGLRTTLLKSLPTEFIKKSPLPLEIMSRFAEAVIPDERRFAGRDPESSESSI